MIGGKYQAGVCGLLAVGPQITDCVGEQDSTGAVIDEVSSKFTASSGTMFDPKDPQHQNGSDGLRLAIGIQMARDRSDYQESDRIRSEAVLLGFKVEMTKESTTILRDDSKRRIIWITYFAPHESMRA